MLTQKAAKDAALSLWHQHVQVEMPRLDRIDRALRPDLPPTRREFVGGAGAWRYAGDYVPEVSIPEDAPPILWDLAYKSETNYLPLMVRTYRQALRLESYHTTAPADQNPWRWWMQNRMHARQGGVNDSALKYGAAYGMALPGELEDGAGGFVPAPKVQLFTPRNMTTEYRDPEADMWPSLAVWRDKYGHLVVVDDEAEYWLGVDDVAGGAAPLDRQIDPGAVSFIEARPHGLGVTPVVRWRDGFFLDGEEQFGIVEPLIQVQSKITETNYQALVAQYFAAFKQRAVIGWVPESEAEELRTSAARVWYLDMDPSEVKIEELSETDLTRYIESGKQARRDLAAIGQIPAQTLGVDALSNISDATLSGLNRSKNERAGDIAVALGEGYGQFLRLMAHVAGDVEAATDWAGEPRWASREAQTWASQVDGLVKLVQSQIMSRDFAIGQVPDLTDQQVEEARSSARRERMLAEAAAFREADRAAAEAARQEAVQPGPPRGADA